MEQGEDGYPPVAVEFLWAKPGAQLDEYVIDIVPFFIRIATVGDTVRVREENRIVGSMAWYVGQKTLW